MLPPLILEKKHVEEAIKKIDKAFEKVNEKIRHFLNLDELSKKDVHEILLNSHTKEELRQKKLQKKKILAMILENHQQEQEFHLRLV